MCCLKHEQNVYEELLKITPKLNAMVVLPDGKVGKVVESNTLTGDLKVQVPDNDVPVKCNRSEVKLSSIRVNFNYSFEIIDFIADYVETVNHICCCF